MGVDTSAFDVDLEDLQIQTDAVETVAREERRRVERAIRGAIMAGYDGVDVNRPPVGSQDVFGIVSILPWRGEPPEGANGYRTERYTWDWFSDRELTAICRGEYDRLEE